MIEKRQQAYLEAMNIPVWVARDQPEIEVSTSPQATVVEVKATPQGLKLGPGTGGSLLVCARDSDSATKLSNDIARSLPNNPVWGWPDSDASTIAPLQAVNDNLFTCVAIFGDVLAQLIFGEEVPPALGSAKLVILPAMSELQSSAQARRQLWSDLCRSGMVVA